MGAVPARMQVCDPALSGWDMLGGAGRSAELDGPTEYIVAALPASEDWSDFQIRRTAEALARLRRLNGRVDPVSAGEAPRRAARPSIVLAYRKLDARTMGRMIAITEHRAFVAAILRAEPEKTGGRPHLDEFETRALREALKGGTVAGFDPATTSLLGS